VAGEGEEPAVTLGIGFTVTVTGVLGLEAHPEPVHVKIT
jgi:hypothetical protein